MSLSSQQKRNSIKYSQTENAVGWQIIIWPVLNAKKADKNSLVVSPGKAEQDLFIKDFYDFYYGKEPLVPLKALAYKNRVIYIKSFSKILMPGLRMGLMVLPKKIQQVVMEAKYTTDISTSGFLQRAMAYYLEENGWEKHADEARRYGSAKYRKTLSAVQKYLPSEVTFGRPNGGVSLWLKLPDGISAELFCSRMLEKNVILTPGTQYDMRGTEDQHIRLSFTNLSDDKIEVGNGNQRNNLMRLRNIKEII